MEKYLEDRCHTLSIPGLINSNFYFFGLYTVFLIVGGIYLIFNVKSQFLLWLNGNHTLFLDFFFKNITFLGDGLFIAILLIPMGIIKIRIALHSLMAYLSGGLAAQIFKRIFQEPRPVAWFDDHSLLHFVEGVRVYSNHSFPSGHTATAFAFFAFLSVTFKSKPLGILFFLLAVSVGLSRIYILQHFFVDVYFGSLAGTLMFLIGYYFLDKLRVRKSTKWFNKPLITVFKKS